jgi:hypothetical protein
MPAFVAALLAIQANAVELTFARPDRELPSTFTRISSVFELRDARLLVADNQERELALIDFGNGSRARAAREGQGPLEVSFPGILLAGAADSAIYYDQYRIRLLLFTPRGTPARMIRYGASTPGAIATQMDPRLIDERGFLYGETTGFKVPASGRPGSEPPSYGDTAQVQRVDPRSGRIEVIARVRNRLANDAPQFRRGPGDRLVAIAIVPDFSPSDEWTVLSDGRVAMLSGGVYRLRIIAPDGRQTTGPEVPHQKIAVTDRDRKFVSDSVREVLRRLQEAQARMKNAVSHAGGAPRAAAPFEINVVEPATWASFKAAYMSISASPDDMLWVATPLAFGETAPRYDVLDASGTLVARVRLNAGERLVGLGRGRVYTIRTDQDDLQHLRRYELPPALRR